VFCFLSTADAREADGAKKPKPQGGIPRAVSELGMAKLARSGSGGGESRRLEQARGPAAAEMPPRAWKSPQVNSRPSVAAN